MTFWRRRGLAAPNMPLEGALGPNGRLDDAKALAVPSAGALCAAPDGRLFVSSGVAVLALERWGEAPQPWRVFETPVAALCASPSGRIAIGLVDGRIAVADASGATLPGWSGSPVAGAIADLLFLSEDELAVVDHGYRPDEPVFSLATWDDEARGRVVVVQPSGETNVIASGLHCPMGVAIAPDGGLAIAEFERAQIVDGAGRVLQAGYPAYLGRIRRIGNSYALTCLSRRDPLIEFLKTEREFVARMKARVDPRLWIAPRANPEFSHDFPIELGATRLFGEIKPWAPSFSYGLVIETDGALMPVGSAHSRANGRRHAISDIAAWDGGLVAVSRASNEILKFALTGGADGR